VWPFIGLDVCNDPDMEAAFSSGFFFSQPSPDPPHLVRPANFWAFSLAGLASGSVIFFFRRPLLLKLSPFLGPGTLFSLGLSCSGWPGPFFLSLFRRAYTEVSTADPYFFFPVLLIVCLFFPIPKPMASLPFFRGVNCAKGFPESSFFARLELMIWP